MIGVPVAGKMRAGPLQARRSAIAGPGGLVAQGCVTTGIRTLSRDKRSPYQRHAPVRSPVRLYRLKELMHRFMLAVTSVCPAVVSVGLDLREEWHRLLNPFPSSRRHRAGVEVSQLEEGDHGALCPLVPPPMLSCTAAIISHSNDWNSVLMLSCFNRLSLYFLIIS